MSFLFLHLFHHLSCWMKLDQSPSSHGISQSLKITKILSSLLKHIHTLSEEKNGRGWAWKKKHKGKVPSQLILETCIQMCVPLHEREEKESARPFLFFWSMCLLACFDLIFYIWHKAAEISLSLRQLHKSVLLTTHGQRLCVCLLQL